MKPKWCFLTRWNLYLDWDFRGTTAKTAKTAKVSLIFAWSSYRAQGAVTEHNSILIVFLGNNPWTFITPHFDARGSSKRLQSWEACYPCFQVAVSSEEMFWLSTCKCYALHFGSEVLAVTLRCSALLASWGWKLSIVAWCFNRFDWIWCHRKWQEVGASCTGWSCARSCSRSRHKMAEGISTKVFCLPDFQPDFVFLLAGAFGLSLSCFNCVSWVPILQFTLDVCDVP